jgi:hypothetical protein
MAFIARPDVELKVIVDEVNKNLTYVGYADTGTATLLPKWRIKKIEQVGKILSTLYADGNPNFDNIWDNRAALTYF